MTAGLGEEVLEAWAQFVMAREGVQGTTHVRHELARAEDRARRQHNAIVAKCIRDRR